MLAIVQTVDPLKRGATLLVEKEVIRPGCYWYRDESTGAPRKLTVTPELTKYWCEQGNAMLGDGLTVPVPYEHDFTAHPMTPKEKLLNNAGEVTKYSLKGEKGDRLFGTVDVQDPNVQSKIGTSIRWTSPWINSFTDGNGKEWRNVISHLALTTRPRVVAQAPFSGIAAALSMASETTVNNISDKGLCLSRAGLLSQEGQPEYPIAFSLWGGIGLAAEHDSATGQFTGPGGGNHSDDSHSKTNAAVDHSEAPGSGHRFMTMQHVSSASHRAKKAAKSGDHESAMKHHGRAAKLHHQIADRVAADHLASSKHREAAEAHEDAASHHEMAHHEKGGAAMGGDFPPKKGKPKPGTGAPPKPGASTVSDDDQTDAIDNDPTDAIDDADPNADDIESNDDLDGDGTPDILQDANSDIAMEKLLCDLLQALGVPMPDDSNETEFKRHLYEAVMSKIKELTSQGLKKNQDANDPTKNPDQNKPPNQNPNTSHPNKAQNPLIQQEQQPMYMSLGEINKLPDPMRGVALAMYNENAKLRAELEAGAKVSNSLRDGKIKEENAKRTSRVALLSRLSPRVKADLDAMLALPAMALSMGDGGTVVDPMAQTLAILEKGLADMPRLLTVEHTALSVHPHPQDADAMTQDRVDEIADTMARQMGCPPEKKAG